MKTSSLISCAATLCLLCACNDNALPPIEIPETPPEETLSIEVTDQALDGQVVKQVVPLSYDQDSRHSPDYAATTERGLYLRKEGQWLLSTPDTWHIRHFIAVNEDYWLISYLSKGINYLAKSVDRGLNWENQLNNFGSNAALSEATQEPLFRMTTNADGSRLYAVGTSVLAESLDHGQTWQALSGNWDSFGTGMSSILFVGSSPEDTASHTLFYGGQGAIEQPLLFRFDVVEANDGAYSIGEAIQFDVSAQDLLPAPAVVEKLLKLPSGDTHFLATGEGGFIKTEDNGESWISLSGDKDYRFYFDMLIHPDDHNFWVTAGWKKNFDTHQPLIIEVSKDAGKTWQTLIWEGENEQGVFGGVWSMSWKDTDTNTLHLGTYRGGIFTVRIDD
ncbi:hypothetical protein DRW07_18000 [Alteromonas sediminis]|uniref:Exo-alpha-sialidase n=1 Tax=Alteromonas sediminis TaxID=2259342 RepID=A0A3N5XVS6_9ALTE|nr:hypothetical protein [Alteromonas sediminis]RPJ64817.1 hypothetical protein DRW07_18000 [Alteromonas sediminis]